MQQRTHSDSALAQTTKTPEKQNLETDILNLDAELQHLELFSKELRQFCRENYDYAKSGRLFFIGACFYYLGVYGQPDLDLKTGNPTSSFSVDALAMFVSMMGSMASHILFSISNPELDLSLTQTTSGIREKTEGYFPDMLLTDRIYDLNAKLDRLAGDKFNLLQTKLRSANQYDLLNVKKKPHFTYLKPIIEGTLKDTHFLYDISLLMAAGLGVYLIHHQQNDLKDTLATIVTEHGKTCAELFLQFSGCKTPVNESDCVSTCTDLYNSHAPALPLGMLTAMSGMLAFAVALMRIERDWNYAPIQKIQLPLLKSNHSPSLFKRFVCRSMTEVVNISERAVDLIGFRC